MSDGDNETAARCYESAIDDLNQILAAHGDDARALLSLAVVFLNLSNIDASTNHFSAAMDRCSRGIEHANRVLAVDRKSYDARDYLCMLHGNRAYFGMRAKRYAESIDDWLLAESFSVDPDKRDYCRIMWIRNLIWLERYTESFQAIEKIEIEKLSGQNQFALASLIAWLASREISTDVVRPFDPTEKVSALMDGLKHSGSLFGNVLRKDHVSHHSDFEVIRSRLGASRIARWFEKP
jgi:tetratricopeptide (TPR) repeat protein